MKPYDEESEIATYVLDHFSRFLTPVEAKARWAVFAEAKRAFGRAHVAESIWKEKELAEDPAVMALLHDGVETFRRRAAQRILHEHAADVFVNRCPKCGRVVSTPKARQCLWCGFDWHGAPPTRVPI